MKQEPTDLAWFYGKDPISDWKAVLGEEMPYTFGHFYRESDDLQTAQQQAIRLFYPEVAPGSTVLDLGCGWGHPARRFTLERKCRMTCVSNTREQIEYIRRSIGINDAFVLDLENGFPVNGQWDVAIFMESLEHIQNKNNLLADLRGKAAKLIIRTDATRLSEMRTNYSFGGTMLMLTEEDIAELLHATGWKIESLYETRKYSWPSLLHWKRNIERHFRGMIPDGNFQALYALCLDGINNKDAWIHHSPLYNVIATPA